jgi:hypothetical protein
MLDEEILDFIQAVYGYLAYMGERDDYAAQEFHKWAHEILEQLEDADA